MNRGQFADYFGVLKKKFASWKPNHPGGSTPQPPAAGDALITDAGNTLVTDTGNRIVYVNVP